MTATAEKKLSVDEFLAWAEGQEGRFELHGGDVVAMSPERLSHLETKGEAYSALKDAIKRTGSPYRAVPDGATLRIDALTAFEPDAMVYCGPRPPSDAVELPNPVIVVEVLSPSTAATDRGAKLRGYFSLTGLVHYHILDADARLLIHHRRGEGAMIETRIYADGRLRLDPPGLDVSVEELFAPA
jgi:Uma2 family endonuclease